MKKIILTLFLILGLASFAAPKFVDTDKLQNAGYQITADDEDLFSFAKATDEAGVSVALYLMPNKTAKSMSNAVKDSAPDDVKLESSIDNKRAYILKFAMADKGYTYKFVPKKHKVKDYHISVLYITDKNLSGASLDKVVDNVLNEAESFLK